MILLHQRRAKRKLPFARTGVDSNKKQVAQNATSTVERRIQPRFESRQFDRSTPYRFVKTRFEAVSRFSSLPHSATFVRQNIAGLFAGNDRERAGGVRAWIKSRRQQGVAFFRYAFPRERAINGGCKMQVASFDGYRRSFGTACYMRRVFSNRMSRHDGTCSAVSLSLSLSFCTPSFLHPLFLSCPSLPLIPCVRRSLRRARSFVLFIRPCRRGSYSRTSVNHTRNVRSHTSRVPLSLRATPASV